MTQFGRKNVFPSIARSRVTFAVLLLLCGYLSLAVFERFTVEREMAARLSDAEQTYEVLKARHTELDEKVEYLQGEPGIESEIRKHFDVAREGEQVVIIVDDEDNNETTAQETTDAAKDELKPWYRFW